MQDVHLHDRRLLKDRRLKPTSPLTIASLFGSRKYARRQEDKKTYYYVDIYNRRQVTMFLTILMLSVVDGFLTLHLLNMGAEEINPVMRYFLQLGAMPFFLAKYSMSAIALTCLLIHKNYYLLHTHIKTEAVFTAVSFLYGVLVAYELILVFG